VTVPGEAATLTGSGKGRPGRCRSEEDNLVTAFSIVPEGGQGSDLRACETDVAHTLSPTGDGRKTERGTRLVQGAAVRRLTPLECERLQGFPDDWTKILWTPPTKRKPEEASDSARYAAMGNAVACPVIEWIGRRLALAVASSPPGSKLES